MLAMLILAAVMVWAFFTFNPDYVDQESLRAYNYSALFVIFLFCAAFSFKAYAYLESTRYEDFLPILLFLMNMMIIAIGLVAGFLVRNFFIFKSGRGFFNR